MKNSEILRKVQEKLSDPKRWCKGEYARTANGDRAYTKSPEAASWCLAGAESCAIEHVPGPLYPFRGFSYDPLSEQPSAIAQFNDAPDTTHLDIMTFLDFAILAAEDEEALCDEARAENEQMRAELKEAMEALRSANQFIADQYWCDFPTSRRAFAVGNQISAVLAEGGGQ